MLYNLANLHSPRRGQGVREFLYTVRSREVPPLCVVLIRPQLASVNRVQEEVVIFTRGCEAATTVEKTTSGAPPASRDVFRGVSVELHPPQGQ